MKSSKPDRVKEGFDLLKANGYCLQAMVRGKQIPSTCDYEWLTSQLKQGKRFRQVAATYDFFSISKLEGLGFKFKTGAREGSIGILSYIEYEGNRATASIYYGRRMAEFETSVKNLLDPTRFEPLSKLKYEHTNYVFLSATARKRAASKPKASIVPGPRSSYHISSNVASLVSHIRELGFGQALMAYDGSTLGKDLKQIMSNSLVDPDTCTITKIGSHIADLISLGQTVHTIDVVDFTFDEALARAVTKAETNLKELTKEPDSRSCEFLLLAMYNYKNIKRVAATANIDVTEYTKKAKEVVTAFVHTWPKSKNMFGHGWSQANKRANNKRSMNALVDACKLFEIETKNLDEFIVLGLVEHS